MGKPCAAVSNYCHDAPFNAKLMVNCRRTCGACGPCALAPCKNGGRCLPISGTAGAQHSAQPYDVVGHFKCVCLSGYMGLDCSLAIATSACLDGGIFLCKGKHCKDDGTAPSGFICEGAPTAVPTPTQQPTTKHPTSPPKLNVNLEFCTANQYGCPSYEPDPGCYCPPYCGKGCYTCPSGKFSPPKSLRISQCITPPPTKQPTRQPTKLGATKHWLRTVLHYLRDDYPHPLPPPPPPTSKFCPQYHPIHAGNVYDPSGPLIAKDGTFHTWEDAGSWSHWWSEDLIHWNGNFSTSTAFGADTGSVSPTPSGVYAFWPIMDGKGKGSIASAASLDPKANLEQWDIRGATIAMPKRINAGFRDPVRAFEYPEKSDQWWVGVGGGNNPGCVTSELAPSCGAQFCLFKAKDNTLAELEDAGALYTTNVTFGQTDGNIVWQNKNTSANMMECPDLGSFFFAYRL